MNFVTAPGGSTDTHVHVYQHGYPLNPLAKGGVEPSARLSDYRREMTQHGIDRVVIVQPSAYGTDNRCTLAGVAALGSAARGVAILEENVSDREIEQLSAQRIVGLRCLLDVQGGMMDWNRTRRMAPRFVEHGWHLDLQFAGRDFVEREAFLRALPGTLVIDHLGKFTGTTDSDGPAMAALLRLLDSGRVWVKLSAPYHADRSGPPAYADVHGIASRLIQHAPERCVWASNWPHPGRSPRPDTAVMLKLLAAWVEDAKLRRRILVDNPAGLYGFSDG